MNNPFAAQSPQLRCRVISLARRLLFLIVSGIIFPMGLSARDFTYTYEGQTLTYTVLSEKDKTCSVSGRDITGEVMLPSNPEDGDTSYTLTKIRDYAFYGCDITSIIIPSTVVYIGIVALPNTLQKIEYASIESLCAIDNMGCGNLDFNNGYGIDLYIDGKEITEIEIPEGVTSIGCFAFCGYTDLVSISIPSSVTRIRGCAFDYCTGLQKVEFASLESLLNIDFEDDASNPLYFSHHLYIGGEEITDITIPEGITAIKSYVFAGLKSITIPSSVTRISKWFTDFYGLETIKCLGENPPVVMNSSNYEDSFYIPDDVTITLKVPETAFEQYMSSPWSAFSNCYAGEYEVKNINVDGINYKVIDNPSQPAAVVIKGDYSELTDVNLPENITDASHTYILLGIGPNAFYDCKNLTSVSIPRSVTHIGKYAFYAAGGINFEDINSLLNISYGSSWHGRADLYIGGNKITNLTIPDGVTSIGDNTFCNYENLNSITIPNSVTSIGDNAFSNCSISSIDIPNSVTLIGNSAFSTSSLTNITIGNSVKYIGESAFAGTNITSVIIPNSVEYIGKNAFTNSSLVSIELSNSLTTIEEEVFKECINLTSVIIPNSVISIGKSAFYHCYRLTSVTIPNSVKTIGNSAFSSCRSLTSISIPNSVSCLGSGAFSSCYNLKTIILPQVLPAFSPVVDNLGFEKPEYGPGWFENSSPETVFYYTNDPELIEGNTFGYNSDLSEATLYVARGGKAKAQSTAPWSSFGNFVEIQYIESIEPLAPQIKISEEAERQLAVNINPSDPDEVNLIWTSSNEDVVSVSENGTIQGKGKGTAVITVTSADPLQATANISVTVAPFVIGDSNGDGEVIVTDAVNTANYAVGNEVNDFFFKGADVNKDLSITIADAVGTIDEIFKQPSAAKVSIMRSVSTTVTEGDKLIMNDFSARLGETAEIAIRLDNSVDYVGLQGDLILPEGAKLKSLVNGERSEAHTLTYRMLEDNVVRFVLFTPSNIPFKTSDAPLLNMTLSFDGAVSEPVIARKVFASDADAKQYTLTSTGGENNGTSGIVATDVEKVSVSVDGHTIKIRNAFGKHISVYSLDGITIAAFNCNDAEACVNVNPGLYMVKADNTAVKVLVK